MFSLVLVEIIKVVGLSGFGALGIYNDHSSSSLPCFGIEEMIHIFDHVRRLDLTRMSQISSGRTRAEKNIPGSVLIFEEAAVAISVRGPYGRSLL